MLISSLISLLTLVSGTDPDAILQRYADDYAQDPSAEPVQFGIQVDGEWWSVTSRPGKEGMTVTLTEGPPAIPVWYYTLDAETLGQLENGTLNALTAQGKARASDVTPMDIGFMDGFEPDAAFLETYLRVTFHFWTRGLPERIPFGAQTSRPVHGSNATVFFYQPGFRSAFVNLRPGDHANENPEDQVNPFPSLFIPTEGTAKARIGGREIDIQAGEAIFIPPGTAHEFWNPNEEAMNGILLMFGDGA